VERDGFAIIPECLRDEATVERFCKEFDDDRYPQRNLLSSKRACARKINTDPRNHGSGTSGASASQFEGSSLTRLEVPTGKSFGIRT
jgi:hypothetical protein